VGRVSWPKGSNVYKPTAEEIKQAQIDEKKRLEQAKIDEKNRLEQAIIDEKKRLEQAKIDEKNRLEQAKIDEKNRLEQAIINEKNRLEQAKIDEKNRLENEKTYKEMIIGKPVIIGNLVFAQNDFTQKMNWGDANKACEALGDGWRLPTKKELNILYQNKSKVWGFERVFKEFWSSTEGKTLGINNQAWIQNFINGDKNEEICYRKYSVHAVRSY
jgi:hypothetical protein